MKCWRLLRDKFLIYIHQIALKEAACKYRQTNSLHARLALRLFCCLSSLTLKPTWLKRAKMKLAKGNRPQPPAATADPHQQPAKKKKRAFGNKSLQGKKRLNRTVYCWENVHFSVSGQKGESIGNIDVSL